MKVLTFILSIVLVFSALGHAATIKVPGDYPTIQQAINAAVNGDMVLVDPGTYPENIDLLGKKITVTSSAGAASTIIDGGQAGSVVTFQSGEGLDCLLDGFTITNGKNNIGGGIYCTNASGPTIRNNIVDGNTADSGGGIYLTGNSSALIYKNLIMNNEAIVSTGGGIVSASSSPEIAENHITENTATHGGGGIYLVFTSTPMVKKNHIYKNHAHDGGGISVSYDTTPVITENLVYENTANNCGGIIIGHTCTVTNNAIYGNVTTHYDGGGLLIGGNNANPLVKNNLVFGNSTPGKGGGAFCVNQCAPDFENCTLFGNQAGSGGALYVDNCTVTATDTIMWSNTANNAPEIYHASGTLTVTYCDVRGGWTGTGNIDADPLFADWAIGKFHLLQTPPQTGVNSPCKDAGSDLASNVGMDTYWTRTDKVADAGQVDIGFHYGPFYDPPPVTIQVPLHYPTIQQAIDAAGFNNLVLVSPGTYKENLDFKGKAVTVRSKSGASATVIDGNKSGSVARFNSGETLLSVLDGFTLTNGSGTVVGSDTFGGGIFCDNYSSPAIMNNSVEGNTASVGGGIDCWHHSNPLIYKNTVSNNSATGSNGGGIRSAESSPEIRENKISNNSANNNGGGVFLIFTSTPRVIGNEIYGNYAHDGGGMGIQWDVVPYVGHNAIRDNEANNCGGIIINGASPTIFDNVIHGNAALKYNTGGILIGGTGSAPIIQNNCIYENTGLAVGGGISCYSDCAPKILNNTFYKNEADTGGGIYCTDTTTALIRDCILWHDIAYTGPEIYVNMGTPTVEYCDVEGGWPGTGNFGADPLFNGPLLKDFHLKQHPVQPGVTNPCVDKGSDLAANVGMDALWTRTDGVPDSGVVDIGFHYGPETPPLLNALTVDVEEISASTGGTAVFLLTAGAANAFRQHVMLGSVTGTSPGTPLPGGMATLPLNWDLFTNLVVSLLNTPVFQNFVGYLGSNGEASAVFNVGPIPGGAGITMYYAYALNNPWNFVSNPVSIKIIP